MFVYYDLLNQEIVIGIICLPKIIGNKKISALAGVGGNVLIVGNVGCLN